MSARKAGIVTVLSTVFLLGSVQFALADNGIWTAAATWEPSRLVLGIAGVLLAALLAAPQHG